MPSALRVIAILTVWSVPAVVTAGPRDDLLRLVPDDYTFCVVVQNLRDQAKADGESSFLKGLADSPFLKKFHEAPEAKKFQEAVDTLLKELEVTPDQFANDIFGDALVFTYRKKGAPGQPETEDGLVLLHARDAKLLARLVDRINHLQTKAGELKAVEPVDGKDGKYFRRVMTGKGGPGGFYAVRDHQLLFSINEPLLKETLAKRAAPGKGEPPVAGRMKKLGVSDSPVVWLINPRSFDADLEQTGRTGDGSEQAFVKAFAQYWKAVDGLGVFLNFSPAIEVGLAVNVRQADLPPDGRKFFAEAGKRSPLWGCVPNDALFALIGRVHPESMAGMLGAFLTDQDRRKVVDGLADAARPFLERKDLAALARGFGPDMGFWLMPPDPKSKTWCPQALAAVKVAPGQDGQQAERAALKGLDFLARLACLSNREIEVFEERHGDVVVTGLTSAMLFPPGFRPCFAAKGGYLLVAGSPQTIAAFDPPKDEAAVADEVPILRISVSAWRSYLKQHRKELTEFLAQMHKTDPEALASQLDALLPVLDGLERVELVQRNGPDRVSLVVRLVDSRK
jgi:hypothetical protein